jgi:hypothetical protein
VTFFTVLGLIQEFGRINRRILRYLRSAVSEPCGYVDTDYTLCCDGDGYAGHIITFAFVIRLN